MRGDIGKIFEKQWEQVLKTLEDLYLVGWHRFPDTGAAGGVIIQSQPSDYLVALPVGSFYSGLMFIEAKASEKHARLQKSMLRPAQRGAIHKYAELLRVPYLVAFWDVKGSRVEIWDGPVALETGRSKQPSYVITEASTSIRLDTNRVAQQLARLFHIPERSVTLGAYKDRYE